MKLLERIEYYNDNLNDKEIQKEAQAFKIALERKGKRFILLGFILCIASFASYIGLTVYFMVNHTISLYTLIPFIFLVGFSVFIIYGGHIVKLSKLIIKRGR